MDDQFDTHRLQPLWETVNDAPPDIPGCDLSPLPPGAISEWLYRRVIAIRDGLLALEPYRDPADTRKHREQANAAGVAYRHRAAVIETADIRAAPHRRGQNLPPRGYTADANVAIS